jgi:hypothetical protein
MQGKPYEFIEAPFDILRRVLVKVPARSGS